jgi:hypothetical protein
MAANCNTSSSLIKPSCHPWSLNSKLFLLVASVRMPDPSLHPEVLQRASTAFARVRQQKLQSRRFQTGTLSEDTLHRLVKWVMLASGLLTCTMFYAAIAPEASLRSVFGQSIDGPVASIVVRNWGALIGLMGVLLIYGALHDPSRRIALLVVGASKVVFIGLVLSFGQQFLQFQIGIAVAMDTVVVVVFAAYLIATRTRSAA